MIIQLLEKIALSLEERQIPYMIIGGQAVLIYGEPRLTRDVDVTLGVGPERLKDLLSIAQSSGWRVLVEKPQEFVERTLVLPLQDTKSTIRIDFIFSYSPYERQALERVRSVNIGRANVRFAAAEDIIVHKIVAGRPRDLEDVRGILLKKPEINREYIRHWLSEFERSAGKPCVRVFDDLEQSSR